MIKRILFILIIIAALVAVLEWLSSQNVIPVEVLDILEDIWTRVNDWLEAVAGISFREIIISIVDIFVAIFEAFIAVIRWLADRI